MNELQLTKWELNMAKAHIKFLNDKIKRRDFIQIVKRILSALARSSSQQKLNKNDTGTLTVVNYPLFWLFAKPVINTIRVFEPPSFV